MAPTPPVIAYLTVISDDATGWTGGLLLLNSLGRPLEFQCTLPVRPSRAHHVLFGSTLTAHLIGEVIGPLLVKQCRTPMTMLCCDQFEAMAIGEETSVPTVLATDLPSSPMDQHSLVGYEPFEMAGSNMMVPIEKLDQAREIAEAFRELPDALEPFERIREAIKEAQSQISLPAAKAA